MYTMDNNDLTESNFMENSIGKKKLHRDGLVLFVLLL